NLSQILTWSSSRIKSTAAAVDIMERWKTHVWVVDKMVHLRLRSHAVQSSPWSG
ncbi:hypothetical protein Dimus_022797, partial [Dionaea muscipula]